MAGAALAGRAMTIGGVRRRIGQLERRDGPGTGLVEALEEGRRRVLAGLPPLPRSSPSAEELSRMPASLRGAWQRLIQGRKRVADHVPTTG